MMVYHFQIFKNELRLITSLLVGCKPSKTVNHVNPAGIVLNKVIYDLSSVKTGLLNLNLNLNLSLNLKSSAYSYHPSHLNVLGFNIGYAVNKERHIKSYG